MIFLPVFLMLSLTVFFSGCLEGVSATPYPSEFVIGSPGIKQLPVPVQIQTPDPTSTPTLPTYIPTLRPYYINKEADIWRAQDPSSYIIPNDPWVQYYALTGETPQIFYQSDKELYPQNRDEDYWQNADYTLFTGYGDCEDLSIAMVSIYIAKGYKAVVVGGYLKDDTGTNRDFWYEIYNPNTMRKTTITTSGSSFVRDYELIPKYMFNNQITWRQYNEEWY